MNNNQTNNDFFQDPDYKIPVTSNYMKFVEGENTFRVLSSAIVGYVYFNNDKKPIRLREQVQEIPDDLRVGDEIKHFWAFVVWNYDAKRLQILELTQKGIMKTMKSYINNKNWGNPREYDFIVTRSGSGLDTDYAVAVNPKSELPLNVKNISEKSKINLESLFDGKDPFKNE